MKPLLLSLVILAVSFAGCKKDGGATAPQPEAPNGLFANLYSGTFVGDDHGSWIVVVDDHNACTGKGHSTEDGDFDLTGTVNNRGVLSLIGGTASLGATFTGQVEAGGAVSGSWRNDRWGYTGTFSGNKWNTGSVYRVSKNREYSFSVNLPATIPSGFTATLMLKCTSGIGGAVFNNGQPTIQVSRAGLVTIRGTSNSSVKNNIVLKGQAFGTTVILDSFSVRTWPTAFRQVAGYPLDPPSNGTIQFKYEWDSESGDTLDLFGIFLGESVDYPGNGPTYDYASPPYRRYDNYRGHPEDPTVIPDTIGVTRQNGNIVWCRLGDTHRIPTTNNNSLHIYSLDSAFVQPYRDDGFIATQYYWFRDPVLMLPYEYSNLSGPHYIRRNVYNDNGWKYRVEKDNVSSVRSLPLQY